jgi:hypothetical protein
MLVLGHRWIVFGIHQTDVHGIFLLMKGQESRSFACG